MRSLVAVVLSFFTASPSTASERELVAAVLVLEAAGDGPVGMCAVMNVIVNRHKWGHSKTLTDVVTKRWQFSSLNGRTADQAIDKAKKQPESFGWACLIYDNALSGDLRDLTYGATHFHSGRGPKWAKRLKFIRRIGGHAFYR